MSDTDNRELYQTQVTEYRCQRAISDTGDRTQVTESYVRHR